MKKNKHYCGADHWPKWVKRFLSFAFNPACKVHDLDYGEKTPYTREEADIRFKNHMDRLAIKKKNFKFFFLYLSTTYYFVVMKFGDKQYKGKGDNDASNT